MQQEGVSKNQRARTMVNSRNRTNNGERKIQGERTSSPDIDSRALIKGFPLTDISLFFASWSPVFDFRFKSDSSFATTVVRTIEKIRVTTSMCK